MKNKADKLFDKFNDMSDEEYNNFCNERNRQLYLCKKNKQIKKDKELIEMGALEIICYLFVIGIAISIWL